MYHYRALGDTRMFRATQREIIDLVLQGEQLEVNKDRSKYWIRGELFAEQGDEAFPDHRRIELTREQQKKRIPVLAAYTLWAVLFGIGCIAIGNYNHAPALVVIGLSLLISNPSLWWGKNWAILYNMVITGLTAALSFPYLLFLIFQILLSPEPKHLDLPLEFQALLVISLTSLTATTLLFKNATLLESP
ncbi:MAG: hypothetical protein AAF492_01225 [Verrucomicrobiota bacterium]